MCAFEKVIGYDEIKLELHKIVDIIVNKEKYAKLGVSVPHGLLLYGNPGLGKTLMANSLIEATERNAFICRKFKSNGDFIKEIKDLFEQAKSSAPSIILLDDMDKYANGDEMHRNSEEYVSIQSCIDEYKDDDIFIVSTCNDINNLPDSLLRPGRFDKIIYIDKPSRKDTVNIIKHYLSKKKSINNIDIEELSRLLESRSCAELETIVNDAGIRAGFEGKTIIEMNDMIQACMRVIFNATESLENKNPKVLERIAIHEAGHAVIGEILEPESISLISIKNHKSEIGGITFFYQNEDYFFDKQYMENRVMSLLGGKAATEIIYGDIDTGATQDIQRVFNIVSRFIDDYCGTGFDTFQTRDSSPYLLNRKQLKIEHEIEQFYQKTKKILIQNKEFLDKLAKELIAKETLLRKDIIEIKKTCKN